MKIVQLCKSFLPLSQTFIYDSICNIASRNINCHVLTMKTLNEDNFPYEQVEVIPTPGKTNLRRVINRFLPSRGTGNVVKPTWPGLRAELKKRLLILEPSVVHAQFGPMGILAAPVVRSLSIPLIVTFHGYDLSIPHRVSSMNLYKSMFADASLILTVSKYNQQKLLELGAPKHKVQVLYNGIALRRFPYLNPVTRYDGSVVRLLFIGRLVPVKGPFELVSSFELALKRIDSSVRLTLTIAGDGPELNRLRAYVEKHGLSEYVTLTGAVSHSKVSELMQSHHIYVQHNRPTSEGSEEALGITLIEAQASGLPVVGTKSGGVPEVVRDGISGFLTAPGDVDGMADRIVFLAENPGKWEAMGYLGAQYSRSTFDLEGKVDVLCDIYNRVSS